MNTAARCIASFLVAAAFVWVVPAAAQPGPTLHVSMGSFHHLSDLHPYYATRFDNALVLGAGVSLRVRPGLVTRLTVERVSTDLSGGPVYAEARRGGDNILGVELQFAGVVHATDRLSPFAGGGLGLRRYTVNSAILSDDIIHSPWAQPQTQPAVSAIAGLSVSITGSLGVSGEIKWAYARFRAGEDSWGLPADPEAWQSELRPTLRLNVSPW